MAVGDREHGLGAAEFLDRREPLVLVHRVAGDEILQHVTHAGIAGEIVEPHRERPARRFRRDIRREVGADIAARIDVRHVERHPVGIDRHRRKPGREQVLEIEPAKHRAGDRIVPDLLGECQRRPFEVERDGRRQHLDMAEFLGGRVQQQRAELRIAPRAHGLEEILHRDADFAFDAADRLLQRPREQRVGPLHPHGKLKLVVGVKHVNVLVSSV